MIKKMYIIIVAVSVIWFCASFFYSYYKARSLNDMFYVHNSILLLKDQIIEIDKGIEDFFYEISKQEGKENIIYNFRPAFIEKSENLITSLKYNINKYGCSRCHSQNDVFMKRLNLNKEELSKNLAFFKDILALYSKTKASKTELMTVKKNFSDSVFNLKNDFDKMEHNLHNSLLKKIAFHQRTELIINLLSLVLIVFLSMFFYRKILRNI